jgi:hypothetical protein
MHPTVKERRKNWEKKRPVAVTVVGWAIVLLFIIRLYQVFRPLIEMGVLPNGIHEPLRDGLRLTPLGTTVAVSASYLLQALVGIVVFVGFLRLQRWAWVIMMAWTGVSLCITLINYFYSRPNYLVMASDVIIAVALNQSDVKRIFHVKQDANGPAV